MSKRELLERLETFDEKDIVQKAAEAWKYVNGLPDGDKSLDYQEILNFKKPAFAVAHAKKGKALSPQHGIIHLSYLLLNLLCPSSTLAEALGRADLPAVPYLCRKDTPEYLLASMIVPAYDGVLKIPLSKTIIISARV